MELLDLPDELLVKVVDCLKTLRRPIPVIRRSLHALSLSHPRLWRIVDSELYTCNVEYERSSALLWAVQGGLEGTVRKSLQAKADVETFDFYGQTPLWYAAAGGHETLVRLLLDAGAEPDPKDENDQTALIMAAMYGYRAIVELLIGHGADRLTKDAGHHTPFFKAVRYGHTEVAELLIQLGAAHSDYMDRGNYTMLGRAGQAGHLQTLMLLHANGLGDFEAPCFRDPSAGAPWRCLHLRDIAYWNGHVHLMEWLSRHGIGIHIPDVPDLDRHWKSLVDEMSLSSMSVLYNEHQAKTLYMSLRESVLHRNVKESSDLIFQHDAPTEDISDSIRNLHPPSWIRDLKTPLWLAVVHNDEVHVEMLLKKRCQSQCRNPLRIAIERRYYGVAELLLDHGARPTGIGWDGRSDLMKVVQQGNFLLLQKMLDYGGSRVVNCAWIGGSKNRWQATCLSIAIAKNNPKMVRMLVRFGADPIYRLSQKRHGLRYENKISLFMYALEKGHSHSEVADIMQDVLRVRL